MWPSAIAAARFFDAEGVALRRSAGLALSLRLTLPAAPRALPIPSCGLVARGLRRVARPAGLVRRPCVSAHSRRGRDATAFEEILAAHRQTREVPAEITPHLLRHSFASLAVDSRHSEATIAALVGYMGQTITSRYAHSADAVRLAAADPVANETARRLGEASPRRKWFRCAPRDSIRSRRRGRRAERRQPHPPAAATVLRSVSGAAVDGSQTLHMGFLVGSRDADSEGLE